MPYSPDWEKEKREFYNKFRNEERIELGALADYWIAKLQAREEWLLKSVSDLLEKTELKCDSQVYEECSFCKLKYDLLQLLTPKN